MKKLAWIILPAFLGGFAAFLLLRKKPALATGIIENKNIGSSIIMLTKNPDSNDYAVIVGGTPSAKFGATLMRNHCDKYLSGKNVAYTDWENTVDKVDEFIRSKYPKARVKSVVGFSKGGIRAWPAAGSGKYEFVGLIDPSIEVDYQSVKSSAKDVIMTYLPNRNWGMAGLNYAIKILGNRAVPFKISHLGQVENFMKNYASKI